LAKFAAKTLDKMPVPATVAALALATPHTNITNWTVLSKVAAELAKNILEQFHGTFCSCKYRFIKMYFSKFPAC
jgi:hypothetical protein